MPNCLNALRNLFAVILCFCQPSDPLSLWLRFKDALSEDFLHQARLKLKIPELEINSTIYNQTLIKLASLITGISGRNLIAVGLPAPTRDLEYLLVTEMMRETSYDAEELTEYVRLVKVKLLPEQKEAFSAILERIENNT